MHTDLDDEFYNVLKGIIMKKINKNKESSKEGDSVG